MKAVVTAEFTREGFAALESMGYRAVHLGWGATRSALSSDELVAALDGADVLICEAEVVDEDVLARSPSLRLVAACRGEPTNVDMAAAARRGVVVLATPGRNAVSVADFTIGLLLVEARAIARSQEHLRASGWAVDGDLPYFHFRGPELDGRTLGLIGCGAIGRLVAQRAMGFGMRVVACDPYAAVAPPAVEMVPLDRLLREADVVSIHCPLTPATRGMIGDAELALMRPDAYLVNTARAALVDEGALVRALQERRIAGAALDVFWQEPLPRDHPLLRLSNVTITPHVAGASTDVRVHHARMVVEGIARWQRGEPPAGPAIESSPARGAGGS